MSEKEKILIENFEEYFSLGFEAFKKKNTIEVYKIADRDFTFYQDSYTKRMNLETAKLLKEDAETLKKMVGI